MLKGRGLHVARFAGRFIRYKHLHGKGIPGRIDQELLKKPRSWQDLSHNGGRMERKNFSFDCSVASTLRFSDKRPRIRPTDDGRFYWEFLYVWSIQRCIVPAFSTQHRACLSCITSRLRFLVCIMPMEKAGATSSADALNAMLHVGC